MFLYDKKGDTIDVFSFEQNVEKLRDYKINEMKKIAPNERCLFTKEVVTSLHSTPILFQKDLYSEDISRAELMGKNRSLNYNADAKDSEDLLELYYSESYTNRPVARLKDLRRMRYLLVASNYVHTIEEKNRIIMKIDDIIEIPKSLYLLQLLQQEKFPMITSEDLTEQLSLFDFSYIDTVNFDEIKKMDACGITGNVYPTIIKKTDNDKHILQLLKK